MKEQNLQSHCQHRHGGGPIAIGIKVETLSAEAAGLAGKEGKGSTFIIQIPAT